MNDSINTNYGKELILDLHQCNTRYFTRGHIQIFCGQLCRQVDMTPDDLYFWDDLNTPEGEEQTQPHTKGITAVQFILTSNITIHTLDLRKTVNLNLFSCKDFSSDKAAAFTQDFFEGVIVNQQEIDRL